MRNTEVDDADDDTLYVMLVGKTGHGKSSTGNSIVMREDFMKADNATSVTCDVQVSCTRCEGSVVKVIDTPGVCDTGCRSERQAVEKLEYDLASAMSVCPFGIDCFLLVMRYGSRFTAEEKNAFDLLKAMFTEELFLKYCIVLYTHRDIFEKEQLRAKVPLTFKEWCRDQDGDVESVLGLCRYRCIIFDNFERNEEQRIKLVQMIKSMRKKNGRYSNELFERAFTNRRRLIEEARLPSMSADVMHKLALLREDLKATIEVYDPDLFSVRLLNIKHQAEDLLKEIRSFENTSGILSELEDAVQSFHDLVTDRAGAARYLNIFNCQSFKFRQCAALTGRLGRASRAGYSAFMSVSWLAEMFGYSSSFASPVGTAVGVATGAIALISRRF